MAPFLTTEILKARSWTFGQVGKDILTRTFLFNPDHTIGGYDHPNERVWYCEAGVLTISGEDGRKNWISERIEHGGGGLHIRLRSPGVPDTIFCLTECVPAKEDVLGSQAKPYDAASFLFPDDLEVTATGLRRVLFVGSCLTAHYFSAFNAHYPTVKADYIQFNFAAELPPEPPEPVADYDFQYLQIPIRSLVSDRVVTGFAAGNDGWIEEIFDDACDVLDTMLHYGLKYNRDNRLLTLVSSFVVPQMSLAPSLLSAGSNSDLTQLVSRLNERLRQAIAMQPNVYLCDVEILASSMGKRFFLDDVTNFSMHGAISYPDRWDEVGGRRIEQFSPPEILYGWRESETLAAVYRQMVAMFRTIRQVDQVKAVVFDLDNTLWRGQVAEDYRADRQPWPDRGGWQYGLWEAVQHLRARGILCAICSKNDEEVVRAKWDDAVDLPFLRLQDFVVTKINWRSKAENIAEICKELNIKPKSVVFVDDNPVERESVLAVLPAIRVIGANPWLTRRILLWAPETQVVSLTSESRGREQSIRGQIAREDRKKSVSRPEFLRSLETEIVFSTIATVVDGDFSRVIELTNKTNQFNTTGKRWSLADAEAFFRSGGTILAFKVSDRFAQYGLVGCIFIEQSSIAQIVMSCRVMGMDIELGAVARAVISIRTKQGQTQIDAVLHATADNGPCRDVFLRAGFSPSAQEAGFRLAAGSDPVQPAHLVKPTALQIDEPLPDGPAPEIALLATAPV